MAVHNGARRLLVRETSLTSNAKFVVVWVDPEDSGSVIRVAVGSDPRTPASPFDGMVNGRALKAYLAGVRGALDGSVPAPVTPVADHYVRRGTEVPWDDPTVAPDIELGGSLRASIGL